MIRGDKVPIKVMSDLPAKAVIENENIFIMDETRALSQDIRPLKIALLNLMPLKEATEIQIMRSLSNSPLQVDLTFLTTETYQAKHTSANYLNKFYSTFSDIKNEKFDGFIITGAPIENMEFEEVAYWDEMKEIMEWTKTNVTSTLHLCWGAQAALYYHYNIPKVTLDKKLFGIFEHKVLHRKIPLVRGFDDVFLAPHSRYTASSYEAIENCRDLITVATSDTAGQFLIMNESGSQIFVMGHPEYDRDTLDKEYKRDLEKGLPIDVPVNYYKNDDPNTAPLLTWRAHANGLYSNWLDYYVYQITPYIL